MKKYLFLLLFLAFTITLLAEEDKPLHPVADLVLRHGEIYTVDAARSWAESVAVLSGRIVFVGKDSGVEAWIGDDTKVIELSGRMVLPGFIDSHVHPLSAGIEESQCNIIDYYTKEEILQAIRECAEKRPFDEWILGGGWQLPAFPNANPQKEWLDEIVPDRPVYLTAMDGHSAWANSRALEIAGITRETPDPENGRIERNAQGEPSGTLRESANDLVYRHVPKPKLEEKIAGLQDALRKMNGFGITGFLDASVSISEDSPNSPADIEVYRIAEKRGVLTARVTAAMYADPTGNMNHVLSQIKGFKKFREECNGKYLHATTVKIFADGVIESHTAALLHPYLDKGDDAGELVWQPEKLNPFVELLDREKFQIHIHAIGDRAIRISMNALEGAQAANGKWDFRPVLAHIELIDPADIPRFGSLQVVPSFQPLWAYEDSYVRDLTVPKLGPTRSRWIYPIQSVNMGNAVLSFGSDWSVSSVNPLEGIEVAVTRIDPDLKEGGTPFIPEERISLRDALAAYTIGSAYSLFLDHETGSIEAGKSADLIILSQNLFEIPPDQINQTKVLLTLFEGKEVFRDEDFR